FPPGNTAQTGRGTSPATGSIPHRASLAIRSETRRGPARWWCQPRDDVACPAFCVVPCLRPLSRQCDVPRDRASCPQLRIGESISRDGIASETSPETHLPHLARAAIRGGRHPVPTAHADGVERKKHPPPCGR